MTERINSWLFGVLGWIILNTICVIANFNHVMYGKSQGVRWIDLTLSVTVLFLVYMIIFACRANKTFICVLGGIYIVLGIAGYFVAKYALIADALIIPEVFFVAPYSGMSFFIKSETLCALLFAGFGAVLLLIVFIRYRREDRAGKAS